MTWILEIHHIDVGQGDATLFVAKDTPAPTAANRNPESTTIIRSVLMDGGRFEKATDVHKYIEQTANLAKLNVMIATHYDEDHY